MFFLNKKIKKIDTKSSQNAYDKVKSAFEPSGPSGRRLTLVFVA